MNYREVLTTVQWRTKRQEILYRDNWQCKNCGVKQKIFNQINNQLSSELLDIIRSLKNKDLSFLKRKFPKLKNHLENKDYNLRFEYVDHDNQIWLEVHHLRYRPEHLPWAQPSKDLVSLCHECHQKEHESKDIPIVNKNGIAEEGYDMCDRCGGQGYIEKYRHVQNGICFKCWGRRKLPKYFSTINSQDLPNTIGIITGFCNSINDIDEQFFKYKTSKVNINSFIEFVVALEQMIRALEISTFDERLLISLWRPGRTPQKDTLYMQLKANPTLSLYYDGSVKYHRYGVGVPFNKHEIGLWIQNWKENPLKEQLPILASDFPAKHFRQLHQFWLYEAAVNHEFREKVLKRLLNSH